jgi:hypothetical protein
MFSEQWLIENGIGRVYGRPSTDWQKSAIGPPCDTTATVSSGCSAAMPHSVEVTRLKK